VPIEPAPFRVEGASVPTYLGYEPAEGKVKQVVLQRGEGPQAVLLPRK
jgi:hypothetical protein